jgi:hypothetical protein
MTANTNISSASSVQTVVQNKEAEKNWVYVPSGSNAETGYFRYCIEKRVEDETKTVFNKEAKTCKKIPTGNKNRFIDVSIELLGKCQEAQTNYKYACNMRTPTMEKSGKMHEGELTLSSKAINITFIAPRNNEYPVELKIWPTSNKIVISEKTQLNKTFKMDFNYLRQETKGL